MRLIVIATLIVSVTASAQDISGKLTYDPMTITSPEVKRESHRVRNFVELALAIGGGMTWYWLDRERQVADWDFPGWKAKFSDPDVYIFDNNPFIINYVWHAFAGSGAHALGRANGLSVAESTGWGILSSLFWEYVVESRELISINDIVVTNTMGLAAGEFFHRLGQHLTHDKQGAGWQALKWTLGIVHNTHQRMDGISGYVGSPMSSRFELSYGMSFANYTFERTKSSPVTVEDAMIHQISAAGSFEVFDKREGVGTYREFFHDANMTAMSIDVGFGEGNNGTNAIADTVILGMRYGKIEESGTHSTLDVGLSIGYRYQRQNFKSWNYRLGGAHLPGLAINARTMGNDWHAAVKFRGSYDFVGVHSLGWREWKANNNFDPATNNAGKSILAAQGYYYSGGLSTRLSAELSISRFMIGGNLFMAHYDTIEGFDRTRDTFAAVPLEEEISGTDKIMNYDVFINANVYKNLNVKLGASGLRQVGTLEQFRGKQSMRSYNLKIAATF